MTAPGARKIDNGTAASAYSPAVIAGGLCWVAGQGGLDPVTKEVVTGGVEAQTGQAIRNIAAILAEAGLGLVDIVSVTVYLTRTEDWAAMSAAYAVAFAGVEILPARTAVTVAGLPFGICVEITAVAHVEA